MKSKAVQTRSSLPSVSGAVSDQMEITRKALKKHGRSNKLAIAELVALAELFHADQAGAEAIRRPGRACSQRP